MKLMQRLALLFTLSLGFAAPSAHAGHIGGYLGTDLFLANGGTTSYTTGGFDAAMSLAPNLEIGAFWNHAANAANTMVGGELLLYPLLYKMLYVEGKMANSNYADGTNRIAYGPGAGVNFDVLPMLLSIGADGTYYFNINNLTILGNLKVWF